MHLGARRRQRVSRPVPPVRGLQHDLRGLPGPGDLGAQLLGAVGDLRGSASSPQPAPAHAAAAAAPSAPHRSSDPGGIDEFRCSATPRAPVSAIRSCNACTCAASSATCASRAAHDAQPGAGDGNSDISHDHPESADSKQDDTPGQPGKDHRRGRQSPTVNETSRRHTPNAMGNFCFDVTLSYRRLERPRRVAGCATCQVVRLRHACPWSCWWR